MQTSEAERTSMMRRCLSKLHTEPTAVITKWAEGIHGFINPNINCTRSVRSVPIMGELFDNGATEALVRVATHTYTDVLPSTFRHLENIESKSVEMSEVYPVRAMENLVIICSTLDNEKDERRFLQTIHEMNLIEVILRALEFGLTTTKYHSVVLLHMMLIRYPSLCVGEDSFGEDKSIRERIVARVLNVIDTPFDALAKDIRSRRGMYTGDMVKPDGGKQVAIAYSPRYVSMVKERASAALEAFVVPRITSRQSQMLTVPGLLSGITKSLKVLPHESYPDGLDKHDQATILSSLFHIDPTKDFDPTRELFLSVLRDNPTFLQNLIEIFKLYRTTDYQRSWLADMYRRVHKYFVEIAPSPQDLLENVCNLASAELGPLSTMANLSYVEQVADELASNSWLIETLFEVLEMKGNANERDEMAKMSLENDDILMNDGIYSPTAVEYVRTGKTRIIHYSPSYIGSSVILLRNLMKSNKVRSDLVTVFQKKQKLFDRWRNMAVEHVGRVSRESKGDSLKMFRQVADMIHGIDLKAKHTNLMETVHSHDRTVVEDELTTRERVHNSPKPEEQRPMSVKKCNYCGAKDKKFSRCARCRTALYCNSTCQKADWKTHKNDCH
jgi:hypothetical protein